MLKRASTSGGYTMADESIEPKTRVTQKTVNVLDMKHRRAENFVCLYRPPGAPGVGTIPSSQIDGLTPGGMLRGAVSGSIRGLSQRS